MDYNHAVPSRTTTWRDLWWSVNLIALRLRAMGRSGSLFSPEVSVPYKGNRRGKDYWRRPNRNDWGPPLTGKNGANERKESSLSKCRVQPALSKKEGRVGFRTLRYERKSFMNNFNDIQIIIMAGGVGSRFWPMSPPPPITQSSSLMWWVSVVPSFNWQ